MIQLRPLELRDREAILHWRNQPDVARYMYTDHVISEEEHARWFERVMGEETSKYWVIELDDEGVGVAYITDIDTHNERCFWGFYLANPAVRGRGVGSFVEHFVLRHVFEDMGLNKLCCEVLTFNEAVIGMHESFGSAREGLFRQHIKKAGAFHDVVRLAMLREQWLEGRAGIEQRLRDKGVLDRAAADSGDGS